MLKPLSRSDAASRTYTVQQVATAAGVSRHQIEIWITRGHIRPEHKPAPPAPRSYNLRDVLDIAVFAELSRLGIPGARCEGKVTYARGFNPNGVLVVWQGPMQLIGATDRTTGKPVVGKPTSSYDPANPPFHSEVFSIEDIPALVADPDKRALAMVNLAHVEARVLHKLASLDPA